MMKRILLGLFLGLVVVLTPACDMIDANTPEPQTDGDSAYDDGTYSNKTDGFEREPYGKNGDDDAAQDWDMVIR